MAETPKISLTNSAIKNAKPQKKDTKLYDTGGLFLILKPSGSKLWRLKYRFGGIAKTLMLGTYPDIALKDARRKRDEARKLLADDIDPGAEKKRQKLEAELSAASTFGVICDEFLDLQESDGRSKMTMVKNRWLAKQLMPELGKRPITEIEPFEVLTILKRVERRGARETAKRLCEFACRVFNLAIITSRSRTNPAASLSGALASPKVKHHAAIIEPLAFGKLLRDIEATEGFMTSRLALKISPHLFVRPGELRKAEWSEFDFEACVWKIPAPKMKQRVEHHVPLSRQAIEILAEVSQLTGTSRYVFPSIRSNSVPMSENTINAMLRRMGYGHDVMTAHGFRSSASTLLNELGLWSADAIEHALAHKETNKVRAAYHRGKHWDERVKMAQWWSDHLDRLRHGATVISIQTALAKPRTLNEMRGPCAVPINEAPYSHSLATHSDGLTNYALYGIFPSWHVKSKLPTSSGLGSTA
ncbi:integrase arm-type DNA-binding domain-containing protein [Asticcacaulis sp. MM231]|uniref:tyrosine-type recombinase/integrase n=1 Tax=Asticcacaulis sp. MM231 TaxID=3157666 RepID=UPI0032D5A87A